jgi:hypothetical protein
MIPSILNIPEDRRDIVCGLAPVLQLSRHPMALYRITKTPPIKHVQVKGKVKLQI